MLVPSHVCVVSNRVGDPPLAKRPLRKHVVLTGISARVALRTQLLSPAMEILDWEIPIDSRLLEHWRTGANNSTSMKAIRKDSGEQNTGVRGKRSHLKASFVC